MKIAYLINHLGQTGVNNVVKDLVGQMMAHGHQCRILYFEDADKEMEYGCETSKISFWKSEIDFDDVDVVHTHGLKSNLYVMLHKPLRCKAKMVATLHCYVFEDFRDLYGVVKGFLLSLLYLLSVCRHNTIVALSKHAQHYYAKWLNKNKLTYAYNTRDLDKGRTLTDDEQKEILDFKQDSILIGMNCVLLRRKGIDVLLQALKILPSQYKLFIAGDGKEQETFKTMVTKLGLTERVYMAGQRKEAYRYLPYYDIYALPSRSEGFPLSLLEAAIYKKKVVASRLPIIDECFTDKEILKFDMPDDRELAMQIERASTIEDLGVNLYQRYTDSYSPSQFYERYLGIYQAPAKKLR